MLRSDYLKGRSSICNDLVFVDAEVQKPDIDMHYNPLFDMIFARDERGCIVGDIALFRGEKTNPEVKEFIRQQLMPENSQDGSMFSPSQDLLNQFRSRITDDDIANFSRNHGETREEYGKKFANRGFPHGGRLGEKTV